MKACKTGVILALSGYIFVIPLTSCVTDHQHKQCIIMETETNKNLHVYRFYWLCVEHVIFLLTPCITDDYQSQQYIIMQTIKRPGY